MVIFPRAKINLGLFVTEKRGDGYHNLESVFYPVGLSDVLEFIVPVKDPGRDILEITGIEIEGNTDDNLIIKALSVLREKCSIPHLSIHLHKLIPTGAGLGGGSSDAASFLKVLNRYFCMAFSDDELREVALRIGSDCPFFIDSRPAFATGRGEILKPLPEVLNGKFIVILKPGKAVSTREAFSGMIPLKRDIDLPSVYLGDTGKWKDILINDFEKKISSVIPEITLIKNSLYDIGAFYSAMTCSGSAVYGIFSSPPAIPESLIKYFTWTGYL